MKKVIVLLIGIIFVVSVVLISVFGMEMSSFNETVYATKVDFINSGITEENIRGKITKVLRINYEGDGMEYRLAWHVTPSDVTNGDVAFSHGLDENDTRIEFGDRKYELGLIKINSYINAFTIYITVQDGSNTKDSLYIILRRQAT